MLNIITTKAIDLTLCERTLGHLNRENADAAKGRIALEAYDPDGNQIEIGGIEPSDSVAVVYQFLGDNGEVDDTLDLATFTGDLVMATEAAYRLYDYIQKQYPCIALSLDNEEGGTIAPRVGQNVNLTEIVDNDEVAYQSVFVTSIPDGVLAAQGLLRDGVDCIRFDYKTENGYTVTCDVWNKQ